MTNILSPFIHQVGTGSLRRQQRGEQIVSGKLWITLMATVLYWLIASESRAVAESATSSCPQGELPHLTRTGFEDWWGRDHVPIGDGQVHTYCFTVNMDTPQLALAVGDRTGAAQCSSHVAEYLPPTESGWSAYVEAGRDTSYTFSLRSGLLPKGVWRVRITNDVTPGCADQYQVVAH